MNQIKVSVRDEKGFPSAKDVRYEIEGGCILPGVITALQGIMEQRDPIAILKLTFEDVPLYKKVTLSAANTLSEVEIAII